MTIGYILDDSLDRGDGVQQAVLAIGEHIRTIGHDVHYIVAQTERTDIPNIHSIGSYFSMKFNGNSVRTPKPASKTTVQNLFDNVSFDVLHVQMPFSPFLAARVLNAAPKNVRKVGTFHILPYNFLSSTGTKLLGMATRSTIQSLDQCYAVSEPARLFMEKAYGVKGSVLPNPVDYSFFHRYKRQAHDKNRIVYVGRFDERKGVRQLVEAFARLPESLRSHTELIMVSKGPLHDVVQARAKQLGIEVSFPGFVSAEEKAQYLANADVAVFPSISGESFGIVLTEAMSAGATVTIGGNNPGYASVLEPWPEVLFNPKNIAAFSDILKKFLVDQELARKIGSDQHKTVQQYDVKVVADTLLTEAYV